MAYKTQSREEFSKFLKNIKINQPEEESLVEDFTPIGLSNLYELFKKLKDVYLSNNLFSKLSHTISLNYPELDTANLLHNPITNNQINELLEIIKQEYLQLVNEHNPKNLSEEEQNSLKKIVNKYYPGLFLDFIKEPVSEEEFLEQLQLIDDASCHAIYDYFRQTSPHGQQNSDYLGSSIYLIYRKLYPELSITEPGRKKGEKSFNDNMHKELNNNIENVVPSDIEKGITFSDLEKHIISNEENKSNFTDKVTADFSGITIVLNHIDDSLHLDTNNSKNENFFKLRAQRNDNLKFFHKIKRYLNENDYIMTQEEYFQIYIELLYRLQNSTYPECTHEIKEGSYSTRLQYAIDNYRKNLQSKSFSRNATDLEIEELYNLTDCLKRRLDDKLQHELLKLTFPHVLADPLLIDDFQIIGTFIKDVKKDQGFCAIFYELTDARGRKTEVQLQSNMRYKESKSGLSNHNGMPNKQIDIKPFFELVDNNENPELLEHYLFLLGRTSRAQEEELKERLEALQLEYSCTRIPTIKRQKEISIRNIQKKLDALETARKSIKVKDEFVEDVDMIDTGYVRSDDYELMNIGGKEVKVYHTETEESSHKSDNFELKNIDGKEIKVYDTQTAKRTNTMTIEQYLPIYAEYVSPVNMNVISSAHATAPEAHVNKKDLVEAFTEVLRKRDEVTYLSQILIDKLKDILNIKDTNQISYEELRRYARDPQNGFYAPDEEFLEDR